MPRRASPARPSPMRTRPASTKKLSRRFRIIDSIINYPLSIIRRQAMKISKEARRTARQLIRYTLRDGKVNEDTARRIVAKLIAEKPRHYAGILNAYSRLLRLEV